MRKKLFKIVSVALTFLCIFQFSACDKKEVAHTVWGASNTLKIMSEKHNYPKKEAKIDIFMAKSETEGAQIVITPEDNLTYDLTVSDLINAEGEIFSKDSIKVYVEKMIVSNNWNVLNTDYPSGEMPDMLLPLEVAKKYNENVAKANVNQPLLIEFTSSSATKAGVYTGQFLLNAGNKTTSIPVKVTVYDIDITKAYGNVSISSNYDNLQLIMGEIDNTLEIRRTYFETLLNDYKTPMSPLPVEDGSNEALVKEVLNYWDNPNFTTFLLFPGRGRDNAGKTLNTNQYYALIKILIENSHPGKVLVSRARLNGPDEPGFDQMDTVLKYMDSANSVYDNIQNWLEESTYYEDLQTSGNYTDLQMQAYKEELEKSLRIPVIVTVAYNETLGEDVTAYSPKISKYDTTYERETYVQSVINSGGESWWYNCESPKSPYPTNQIDDHLLSNRIMRWMQFAYDVNGYLYWEPYLYSKVTHGFSSINPTDPYTNPGRYYSVPGDGYYFYPGVKYGLKKPLGSLRVVALRDGQEDYNLLNELELLLKDKVESAQISNFDIHNILNPLYSSLFKGTTYDYDEEAFQKARKQIFDMIIQAKSESAISILSNEIENGVSTIIFSANENYQVTLNGIAVNFYATINGNKYYSYEKNLDSNNNTIKIVASKQGDQSTFEYFVSDSIKKGTDFSLGSTEGLTYSEGSTVSIVNGKAVFDLKARGNTELDKIRLKPNAGFSSTLFAEGFSQIKDLYIEVYNEGETDLIITASFGKSNRNFDIDTFCLKAGQKNIIKITQVYKVFAKMPDADKIVLVFSNGYMPEGSEEFIKVDPGIIKVSDMYYSVKG